MGNDMNQDTLSARRVAGKAALVTGAASGIGRATANLLAQHGAAVMCADIATAGAEDAAGVIAGSGGNALACRLDATCESDWERTIEQTLSAYSRLDILVNSAGVSFASPVTEMRLEDWRRVMAVNLDGIFLGTKHALLAMRRQPAGGSIINVPPRPASKPRREPARIRRARPPCACSPKRWRRSARNAATTSALIQFARAA